LLGVARALHYLHTHPNGPIFHGNVKAKNVLISGDGHALLTGFTCSSLISSDLAIVSPVHGALRWMAPEGIEEDPSPSTEKDVWAFGMTVMNVAPIQEIFTGKPPFWDASSRNDIMLRVMRGQLPERQAGMTDAWWKLCTSCWDSEPSSRPDMLTVKEAIEAVRQQSTCIFRILIKSHR
ncbi:hypothetical protein ID866_7268, partial [Astraeus odoratus]